MCGQWSFYPLFKSLQCTHLAAGVMVVHLASVAGSFKHALVSAQSGARMGTVFKRNRLPAVVSQVRPGGHCKHHPDLRVCAHMSQLDERQCTLSLHSHGTEHRLLRLRGRVVLGAVAMVEPWRCGQGGLSFLGIVVFADVRWAAWRIDVGLYCNVAFKVLVLGHYLNFCWLSVIVASSLPRQLPQSFWSS